MIIQGNFSQLAQHYIHRPGYSQELLRALFLYARLNPQEAITADVGAGTGKLTEDLIQLGFKGFTVEPNDAMRSEGIKLLGNSSFLWSKGSAEDTCLPDHSVDWVLMGSSFHWADSKRALPEFYRILKKPGFFVALWNPRDIDASPFHTEIENWIHEKVPHLKRKSSGRKIEPRVMNQILTEGGYFKNPIFMETSYEIEMSRERYLGAWNSVNDIRSQAGESLFQEILDTIALKVSDYPIVRVPYLTRAWIVQTM